MKYKCKKCGETFPYEPVYCNECGSRFSIHNFVVVGDESMYTKSEVDYLLNDVLNKILCLGRQSDLFVRPTSNKIAEFVIEYLKNPKLKPSDDKTILLKVMNLGMELRQDQLNGIDRKSGVETLDEFLDQI